MKCLILESFVLISVERKFVQYYTQQSDAPMQQLCMDIKYLHIHGAGRNALLLIVICWRS